MSPPSSVGRIRAYDEGAAVVGRELLEPESVLVLPRSAGDTGRRNPRGAAPGAAPAVAIEPRIARSPTTTSGSRWKK